jgi:hypothetical protein
MSSELGTCSYKVITFSNPLATPTTFECKSSNPYVFTINPIPPGFSVDAITSDEFKTSFSPTKGVVGFVQNNLIKVGARSNAHALINYTPSSIGIEEKSELMLSSAEAGVYKYNIKGIDYFFFFVLISFLNSHISLCVYITQHFYYRLW